MTSEWTLTLTHYDESNSYSSTVLDSSDIDSIPMFTDNGGSEVNGATIILNAVDGKFLTSAPIIDQFDKFRIVATDGLGGTYDRVFEVKRIIPSEDNGQGTTAQIECLGNEWYLQHLHYARPQWFKTAFEVMADIGNTYNLDPSTTANGGKLPDLSEHDQPYNTTTQLGNALPKHTLNVYDYGTKPTFMHDLMNTHIDMQASTVDLGGVLDYFDLGFDTDPSDLHKIKMRCPSSGSDPEAGGSVSSLIEIDATNDGSSVNTDTDEQEGGIEAQRATRVLSWGELGTLPTETSEYVSLELDWIFTPDWVLGTVYYVDSVIVFEGNHFKCVTQTDGSLATKPVAGVDTLYWVRESFNAWLAGGSSDQSLCKQYSPWTVAKKGLWEQAGANVAAAEGSRMMWDGNLVINYQEEGTTPAHKNDFFRTWAHAVSGIDGDGTAFSLSGDVTGDGSQLYHDGFRLLNLASGGGGFGDPTVSGTDPVTGKAYENSLLEWESDRNAGNGAFVVKDKWNSAGDLGDNAQIAVLYEGKTFEWDSTALDWTAATNTVAKTDCFHTYDSLTAVDGHQHDTPILEGTKDFSSATNSNYQSAIQYYQTWNKISDLGNDAGYFKGFMGICFQFPFPWKRHSTDYGENIGDLYGNNDTMEPAYLDPQNFNFTSDGDRGFNNANAEDYGQITDLSVMLLIKEYVGIAAEDENSDHKDKRLRLQANFPIRCTVYDSEDNVMVLDQNVPFKNNWTDVHFPLSGFKVYRGAKPITALESAAGGSVIRPKEQELANVFEWRKLKLVSIQLQSFYDDFGRYSPLKGVVGLDGVVDVQTQTPLIASSGKLVWDSFRFTKRNLAMAKASGSAVGEDAVETVRNIEAPFMQRNQVFSKRQLEKDALGEAQRMAFRHKDFVVGTQGAFDIRFADSFLYTNPRIVYLDSTAYDLKTGEAVNTIKLVAKKIEYSMTKVKNGRGGFLRKIYGSRRFE
jgi:hypothetical protein